MGDLLKITNIKTKNFEIGILLEFDKQSCLIKIIPKGNEIKVFFSNFLKFERVD